MSIDLVNRVWDETDVSGSELLVLLTLADHANDTAICWPSLPRIAARARISVRQTQRVIQKLVDAGHIEIVSKGDGRGYSTRYKVLLKGDMAMSTLPAEKVDAVVSPFSEERVTPRAIKGDIAMSTEPPYNHQEKRGSAPPTVHRTLPGVSKPRWRQEKRDADRIAKQRDALGLNAKELTTLTDKVLERMNALELANSDTDFGDEEFTQAQQTTLALASVGYKTSVAIDQLFACWPTEDWRGKKGESPTYKGIVEHAKAMGMRQPPQVKQHVLVVERIGGEDW